MSVPGLGGGFGVGGSVGPLWRCQLVVFDVQLTPDRACGLGELWAKPGQEAAAPADVPDEEAEEDDEEEDDEDDEDEDDDSDEPDEEPDDSAFDDSDFAPDSDFAADSDLAAGFDELRLSVL